MSGRISGSGGVTGLLLEGFGFAGGGLVATFVAGAEELECEQALRAVRTTNDEISLKPGIFMFRETIPNRSNIVNIKCLKISTKARITSLHSTREIELQGFG